MWRELNSEEIVWVYMEYLCGMTSAEQDGFIVQLQRCCQKFCNIQIGDDNITYFLKTVIRT